MTLNPVQLYALEMGADLKWVKDVLSKMFYRFPPFSSGISYLKDCLGKYGPEFVFKLNAEQLVGIYDKDLSLKEVMDSRYSIEVYNLMKGDVWGTINDCPILKYEEVIVLEVWQRRMLQNFNLKSEQVTQAWLTPAHYAMMEKFGFQYRDIEGLTPLQLQGLKCGLKREQVLNNFGPEQLQAVMNGKNGHSTPAKPLLLSSGAMQLQEPVLALPIASTPAVAPADNAANPSAALKQ